MEKEVIAKEAIIIGGSAGALQPILSLLRALPKEFGPAILIVIHRSDDPHSGLCGLLAHNTILPVQEAEDKQEIHAGHVYVAPGGYHLLIEQDHSFSLDCSEKVNFSRPSIDVSFQSAAETFRHGLTAVLLSGANEDGAAGCKWVRGHQGKVIVQDPAGAASPAMPLSVIGSGAYDRILSIPELEAFLTGRPLKQII